jgi:hypothetical protein
MFALHRNDRNLILHLLAQKLKVLLSYIVMSLNLKEVSVLLSWDLKLLMNYNLFLIIHFFILFLTILGRNY